MCIRDRQYAVGNSVAEYALWKGIYGTPADACIQKRHHVAGQFHAVLHHWKNPGEYVYKRQQLTEAIRELEAEA